MRVQDNDGKTLGKPIDLTPTTPREYFEQMVRGHIRAYEAANKPLEEADLSKGLAGLCSFGPNGPARPAATLYPDWKGGYMVIDFKRCSITEQVAKSYHDLTNHPPAFKDEVVNIVTEEYMKGCQRGLDVLKAGLPFIDMAEIVAQWRLIEDMQNYTLSATAESPDMLYEAAVLDISPTGELGLHRHVFSRLDSYEDFERKMAVIGKASFGPEDPAPLKELENRLNRAKAHAASLKIEKNFSKYQMILNSYQATTQDTWHQEVEARTWLYKVSDQHRPQVTSMAWHSIAKQADYDVIMEKMNQKSRESQSGDKFRLFLVRPWQKRFFTLCTEMRSLEAASETELNEFQRLVKQGLAPPTPTSAERSRDSELKDDLDTVTSSLTKATLQKRARED